MEAWLTASCHIEIVQMMCFPISSCIILSVGLYSLVVFWYFTSLGPFQSHQQLKVGVYAEYDSKKRVSTIHSRKYYNATSLLGRVCGFRVWGLGLEFRVMYNM